MSAVRSGSISEMLMNISNSPTLVRISVLDQMVTSSGIVVLAALLYTVLNQQNKIVALIALGSWLAQTVFLVINQTEFPLSYL